MTSQEREQLITDHLWLPELLAKGLCHKASNYGELEDLKAAGYLGLIEAADDFDAERGIHFKTFANWRVRGAMLDYLRSLECSGFRRKAQRVNGKPKLESLEEARPYLNKLACLSRSPFGYARDREFAHLIQRQFKPRDQALMYLYYFEDRSMKEIGQILGVTESRICQIHAELIKALRKAA